jgi:hypothetical protein
MKLEHAVTVAVLDPTDGDNAEHKTTILNKATQQRDHWQDGHARLTCLEGSVIYRS